MNNDAFSRAILPTWMRISVLGLPISAAGALVGSTMREALQGNVSAVVPRHSSSGGRVRNWFFCLVRAATGSGRTVPGSESLTGGNTAANAWRSMRREEDAAPFFQD